jgi:hypothetical protein
VNSCVAKIVRRQRWWVGNRVDKLGVAIQEKGSFNDLLYLLIFTCYIPCDVIYLLHLRQRERCTSYNVKSRSTVLAVTIWCLFTCLNFFLDDKFLEYVCFLELYWTGLF